MNKERAEDQLTEQLVLMQKNVCLIIDTVLNRIVNDETFTKLLNDPVKGTKAKRLKQEGYDAIKGLKTAIKTADKVETDLYCKSLYDFIAKIREFKNS